MLNDLYPLNLFGLLDLLTALNASYCLPHPYYWRFALPLSRWFEDQAGVDATRRAAAACLPRLPGPRSTSGKNTIDGIGRSIEAAPPPAGVSAPSLGLRAHQLPDITRTADLLVVAVG